MQKQLAALLLLIISHSQTLLGQAITGTVSDGESNESLPFATIAFKGTATGTVSNNQGYFQLQLPKQLPADSIVVSYIGYESTTTSIQAINGPVHFRLTPSITQLEELIVLPLEPEDYLKRAIRKFSVNYPTDPFTTQAYYREVFTESKDYITLNEGVFQSSYPSYQDTIPNLHQLVLFRERSDKDRIDFMHEWVEEKEEKEKKKALKKGEEWNEEENTRDIIRVGFGGPEQILKMDLTKDQEEYLDTTKFRKFNYRFGNGLTYQGRDIMEILFESRGTVDHQRMAGVIYLDINSDAILGVEYEAELVIPALVKPLLFAFGLVIKDPQFAVKMRYQPLNGRWYPEAFQWNMSATLKKRYIFQSNEESSFSGHQIFKISELTMSQSLNIPDSLSFDPKIDPLEQVKPTGLKWESINTLPVEDLLDR